MTAPDLPAPRPVLWPLRPLDSAAVRTAARDGRTVVTIRHALLSDITPEMLSWWYAHVSGTMRYAGQQWPRYLVWHPLDHIAYDVTSPSTDGTVGPGARLHITEAPGRDLDQLIDIRVGVEQIDSQAAIISSRKWGTSLVRLENEFTAARGGTRYVTRMTIGDSTPLGRVVLNRLAHAKAFHRAKLTAWIKHHIEEIGNLENFLPDLFRYRSDHEP
ncbi:hypothetical protein E1218_33060 [Kribbella turkmenica]|uniref:Uncharacterized protein n=1 Tax=Kribbella turkmenica TaxID=2530375 RepID=A0A4R4W8P4_9ACTN|nr:hypothetical protein [Kribbella turkmenica]TDD14431.1 hypothetical protein E1218_33060 [Kribbella turkmenica]